jgi:uncharacterized protein (DUF302 family)
MIKTFVTTVGISALLATTAVADLVKKQSPHSVQMTMDKLEAAVGKAGAGVAARVDHAAAAKSVDIDIAPNQVLIFGNPKIGSPIFAQNPAAGLDLPIRVVVYQDTAGDTIVAYHDPKDFAASVGLSPDMQSFQMMAGALNKLTDAAIAE